LFDLTLKDNQLLAEDGIFDDQFFAIASYVSDSTSDKRGSSWFGDILDCLFEAIA
jgi:hypothetical protein